MKKYKQIRINIFAASVAVLVILVVILLHGNARAGIVINTNTASIDAQNKLNTAQQALQKSFQRLSSGMRINTAADDSAGMGVSESLASRMKSFKQAIRDTDDSISLLKSTEGALNKMRSILIRMRELAVQSSNGTLVTEDSNTISEEFDAHIAEIEEIAFPESLPDNLTVVIQQAQENFFEHLQEISDKVQDLDITDFDTPVDGEDATPPTPTQVIDESLKALNVAEKGVIRITDKITRNDQKIVKDSERVLKKSENSPDPTSKLKKN